MTVFKHTALPEEINVTDIVTVLTQRLPESFCFDGETHDFWGFIYVERGGLIVTAVRDIGEPVAYRVSEGELVFMKPDIYHAVRADKKQTESVVITFSCASRAMDYFPDKILIPGETERALISDILRETANAMIPSSMLPPNEGMIVIEDRPFGALQIIKNTLECLLISLIRRENAIDILQRPVSIGSRGCNALLNRRIINFFTANLGARITIPELARSLGVSGATLKRSFASEYSGGVMRYYNAMRINAAKEMLKKGESGIARIAEALGYENIYYFSTAFKKHTGKSPSEYRRSVTGV